MAWNYGGKPQTSQNRYEEQRASFCPPFVFSSGEKATLQLCLNHVKPLRSPQPKLLDESIVFSLVKLFFFFVCELLLIDKPMVTSEPAVTSAQLLGLGSKLYHSNMQHMLNEDNTRFIQSPSRVRQNRGSERKAVLAGTVRAPQFTLQTSAQ